jgi:energy-coupling factor transport system permease protein
MSEFEFLRNVTIGQYVPRRSRVHRLDPRVKLLAAVLLVAGTIACRSLLAMVVALVATGATLALAHLPVSFALRGLRPALPFLTVLAVLQMVTVPQNDTGKILWQWWQIVLTPTDLWAAGLMMMRFIVLILQLSVFTMSTTTTDLTHGVEHLLHPAQRIGFPGHEVAMTVIIAIRFVPLLALEAERLAKAQASRGADFGQGKRNPLKRARQMLPLLVPLFVTALRRAETLILAMEARCYTGGRGRTSLIQYHLQRQDIVALFACVVIAMALGATAWVDVDTHLWRWLR